MYSYWLIGELLPDLEQFITVQAAVLVKGHRQ
jgi:hypothetical protein